MSSPQENKQSAPEAQTTLKSTLTLPRTTFAMKANLPQNEPVRLEKWATQGLYNQIRTARASRPKYLLHDGPPYANGPIHLGHALNKCIKDMVVKSRTMEGYDSPYVPGWDCHGLPIEIKVDEQLGRKKLEMPALSVRRACRQYAEKYVDLQRSQFVRLGIFGRWADPYLTMSTLYESKIVEAFYNFYEKDFVYKGLKPVYWCTHDRTALAEAEVEYEQHQSPSIYVRYFLTSRPEAISPALVGKKVAAIIWTTTPWTIPYSYAIVYHPEFEYLALEHEGTTYLVVAELAEAVKAACNLGDAIEVARFKGSAVDGAIFRHPFLERDVPAGNADYVTTEQGTGAVHTSPGHGPEDFYTGARMGLPQISRVDDSGILHAPPEEKTEPAYAGKFLTQANPLILDRLRESGALLAAATLDHSYPHCWRCHNPVIYRATEQWFIGMETPMTAPDGTATTFRQRTLDIIQNDVTWDPSWGRERISNMIATRPDWCISRQRIWGVPIAVFLCQKCSTPLKDAAVHRSIVELFRKEGADAWYRYEAADLLPAGTACSCGHTSFRKEMDILDVWFESGASWYAVCEPDAELGRPLDQVPADMYTEGGDQHRGWFHSSLLLSVGIRNRAPYKYVATSGWTLDEQGRAFSKSLGNGVDPVDIAKRLGAEIVRLWVASVDFREDVSASENLMQRCAETYRKLRNTFRFLLGNLDGFNPAEHSIPFEELEPLDRYMLARTADLTAKVRQWYQEYEFHRIYQAVNEFAVVDLSSLYLDVLKDRMYTYPTPAAIRPAEGWSTLVRARLSAQTVLWQITEALVRLLAPMLTFTSDEVWEFLPAVENRPVSVHIAEFPSPEELFPADRAAAHAEWDQLFALRDQVLLKLEDMRKNKTVGKSLEAKVRISATGSTATLLNGYAQSLAELFNVSDVTVEQDGTAKADSDTWIEVEACTEDKCERCWRYTPDVAAYGAWPKVCQRCREALTEMSIAEPAVVAQ